MQRLTLVLSDLHLPEEGVGVELPLTHDLPGLSWLLRVANRDHIGDWRQWLLREVGGSLDETPLAEICARERVPGPELESAWLATPVALEARLDHVRMTDRGLLRLDAQERAAWCSEFNQVFGPSYSLHDGGERGFFLTGVAPVATPIVDPARLLGADVANALPGAAARELRRLWTEIEMWLHGAALNGERERAGKRRISALWIWGRSAGTPGARRREERDVEFRGGDPLMVGLSRLRKQPLRDVPQGVAHCESAARHVVAEFAPLTGSPQESLPALDVPWFKAARQALEGGSLSMLEIIANDHVFRVTPRAGWRFWRRRRGWLDNLAYPPGMPRA
jgi:hypothetical protein